MKSYILFTQLLPFMLHKCKINITERSSAHIEISSIMICYKFREFVIGGYFSGIHHVHRFLGLNGSVYGQAYTFP